MNNSFRRPFRLQNKTQHYDWGTKNDGAFIPHFTGSPVVRDLPYAELWIGAHPSASSDIVVQGHVSPLNRVIEEFPLEILGEDVAHRFDGKLPFLLKILSAARALSIQTHPNREQARRLHSTDPAHYPDDNHKPEIAIALDSLMAIAGFRPAKDIVAALRRFPELDDIAGNGLVGRVREAGSDSELIASLKLLYGAIMRRASDETELIPVIAAIVDRLSGKRDPGPEEVLFVEQYGLYGADVGLFSFLFFNLIHLKSGQAIFTEAGIPHAYIRGNIVECMANSDNVVRAGLTGKFKDVGTLLDILTYRFAEYPIINREQKADGVVYHTGAGEFEITAYQKDPGFDAVFESGGRPAVVLVTGGSVGVRWEEDGEWMSERFTKGESFLIPAILSRWRMSAGEKAGFYCVRIPLR
ncbi:MAG TPA: mannose-6-phosphate isomerase, class I [Bacteroidota bacterium]